VKDNYESMKSLMAYVLGRRNEDGLLEGLPGDWIFIDWAAGLSKEGTVSFEQLLFVRSLETMSMVADLVGEEEDAGRYSRLAEEVKAKIFDIYWNKNKKAIVHSYVN